VIVADVEPTDFSQPPEFSGDRADELISVEGDPAKARGIADLRWDGATEVVIPEIQIIEVRQPPQFGRDRAGKFIVREKETFDFG